MQQLFKGDNYSEEETIRGNMVLLLPNNQVFIWHLRVGPYEDLGLEFGLRVFYETFVQVLKLSLKIEILL